MIPRDQGGWIEFIVWGHAQPAGSKQAMTIRRKDGSPACRPGGTPLIVVFDSNPKAKSWMQEVKSAASDSMMGRQMLEDCDVEVCMLFVRVRPKSHYGTGKNASIVKASAPKWPRTKPDLLKTARAIEDAMTGIVYRDDASTVKMTLEKTFGERECVMVRVRRIDDDPQDFFDSRMAIIRRTLLYGSAK